MRKIFYLSFIVFAICILPVFADGLSGGVTYNVKTARQYVQSSQVNEIAPIKKHLTFVNDDNILKMTYSYQDVNHMIARTVVYKGETQSAYIYDGTTNQLKYIDKYDKDVNTYPHRGYRYNLEGKLILTCLTINNNEQYRFSPDGKLLAHSANGIIYDENGKIIGMCATNP